MQFIFEMSKQIADSSLAWVFDNSRAHFYQIDGNETSNHKKNLKKNKWLLSK